MCVFFLLLLLSSHMHFYTQLRLPNMYFVYLPSSFTFSHTHRWKDTRNSKKENRIFAAYACTVTLAVMIFFFFFTLSVSIENEDETH